MLLGVNAGAAAAFFTGRYLARGFVERHLPPRLRELDARLAENGLRTVIVLCDLEGRTRKEAAAILGWPEGTVAGRLARARRKVRGALGDRMDLADAVRMEKVIP